MTGKRKTCSYSHFKIAELRQRKTKALSIAALAISKAKKKTFALWFPVLSTDTTTTLKCGPSAEPHWLHGDSEAGCRCAPHKWGKQMQDFPRDCCSKAPREVAAACTGSCRKQADRRKYSSQAGWDPLLQGEGHCS